MRTLKLLGLAMIVVLQTGMSPAKVAANGSETTNGGAGVELNGDVVTIGSAQILVHPLPQTEQDIPGMKLLVDSIRGLTIPLSEAMRLVQAILPDANRKYVRASEAELDRKTIHRLNKQYSKLTGLPPEKIRLFALTKGNTTVLLPDFFSRLTEIQQAALLFHEALWVLFPHAAYNEVVEAEVRFEAYLQQRPGYSLALYEILAFFLSDSNLKLVGAIVEDQKAGRLKPFLNERGELTVESLIGKETLRVLTRNAKFDEERSIRAAFIEHLVQMITQYPEVQLFRQLYDLRFNIHVGGDAPSERNLEAAAKIGFKPWEKSRSLDTHWDISDRDLRFRVVMYYHN